VFERLLDTHAQQAPTIGSGPKIVLLGQPAGAMCIEPPCWVELSPIVLLDFAAAFLSLVVSVGLLLPGLDTEELSRSSCPGLRVDG
jgi:hypothetical protein